MDKNIIIMAIMNAIDNKHPLVIEYRGDSGVNDHYVIPHIFGLRKPAKSARLQTPTNQLFGYAFDPETREAAGENVDDSWRSYFLDKIVSVSHHEDDELRWLTWKNYELLKKVDDHVKVYRAFYDSALTKEQWDELRSTFSDPEGYVRPI